MEVKKGYKQTEVGVIPEEWEVKKLAEVADIVSGGTPSTNRKEFWDGDIFWCTPTDITALCGSKYLIYTARKISPLGLKNCSAEVLPKNSIVMTTRATIGECAINKISVSTNQGFKSFIPKEEINAEFLYYKLLTQKPKFVQLGSGSTFFEVSKKDIKDFQIPLPPTKSEQTTIATALSDADALITSLKKLITKKRHIKQGAMQELLTGKKRLPGFNGEWQEVNMAQNSVLKARIGWQGLTTAEYLKSGDCYLVTGTDFFNGRINWSNCCFVDESRYVQDKNIQLKVGDILLTKDGTIGKVGYVDALPGPATLNSGVFVIRPKNNAYSPLFFYYILTSRIFDDFLVKLLAGSTISHLYQKDFISFSFMAPKLEEQTTIAQVLSDMDAEIEELEQKLDKYRLIKQGMMQELLTGKTRLI